MVRVPPGRGRSLPPPVLHPAPRETTESSGMYLHSVGHFHPENVVTNAFLQELGLETTDAWIRERVGIVKRHTVLPLDYLRETRNRDVREAMKVAQYSNAET